MQQFVGAQYDFFFFVAGLSFLMLGAVSLSFRSFKSIGLLWHLLGMFAVLQGVSEFLTMVSVYMGQSHSIFALRFDISLVAYSVLWEFSRRDSSAHKQPKRGSLSVLPVIVCAVVVWLFLHFGSPVVGYPLFYAFGLISSVYASVTIYRHTEERKEGWGLLSAMGIGLGTYAVVANLLSPLIASAAGSVVNSAIPSPDSGFVIPFFHGVAVFCTAVSAWYYSQITYFKELKMKYSPRNLNFSHIIILVLGIILLDSWMITNTIGHNVRSSLSEEGRTHLDALYEQINAELRNTDHVALTISTSAWLPLVLENTNEENLERANVVLDRYQRAFRLETCYLMDSKGNVVASSNRSAPESVVGRNYSSSSYFIDSASGDKGKELEFATEGRRRGYVSSMPVRNQNGKVIGVVVARSKLNKSEESLLHYPLAFLVNSQGIILLSSKKELEGASLWPLAQTPGAIVQPFGTVARNVFTQEARHGETVLYNNREYSIGRKHLLPAGWSIIFLQSLAPVQWYRFLSIGVSCFLSLLVILLCIGIRQKENVTLLLAREKEKAQQYFEVAGVIMVVLDHEGRINLINKRGCDTLGYRYEDILHQNWFERCIPERVRPEVKQLFERMEAGEDISYYENFVKTRTGEERLIAWYNVVLHGDDNGVVGTLSSGQDITDRKDTAEQLIRAYAELKTAQDQLIQSEKMASIGQLAAGVAHEINNPTGFVISNLDLMQEYVHNVIALFQKYQELEASLSAVENNPLKEQLDRLMQSKKEYNLEYMIKELPELVSESHSGAKRIKKIVQDLMTFSRREDGEKVNADLNDILESTLTIAWNELKYKATVGKNYGALPPVYCNPNQMGQVFLNLLINAVQAIETKGEITIKTYAKVHGVFVEISDSGCGIPPENLKKIFDPFFTTKPAGKGTGLGLSLVYNILPRHNGDISARSSPGRGTTFVVRLPIAPHHDSKGIG